MTNEQTNEMNEKEIFEEALKIFVEKSETVPDFLGLDEHLFKQTNYIPLPTPKRGSYNLTFEIRNKFAKLGIKDWSTFEDTEALIAESIKESAAVYKRTEEFIATVNEVAKNKLNELINDETLTPKDIVCEMFKITDKARNTVDSEIDYMEKLADTYATMNIIKALQDVKKKHQFKVNFKKLRGILLDLKFTGNGLSFIDYEVIVKRGTPAKWGAYQCKRLKGKF